MQSVRSSVIRIILGALVVATVTRGATGADVPVDGRRLYLTDASDPARRGAQLSLVDPDLDLTDIDPTITGATVEIGRVGGGSATALDLPAAGWTRRPAGSGHLDFRFRSKAGPVRSARLVQSRSVRLSARGTGSYALDGAPQRSVGVVITVGDTRFCALFGGTVQRDNGRRFLARRAPAPATCPFDEATTTTSTTTSTATTTSMPTTTTLDASTTTTSTTTEPTTSSTTTTETTTSTTTTTVTTTTEPTTTTTLVCNPNAGTFVLGFQSGGGEPLALSLNRASLNALIDTAEQKTRVVRDVSLASPLTSAVTALKDACGTGWKLDQADPQFDCSLTALGQTFRGPDGTAKSSSEFALLRVLDMTPANANVDNTSVESLKDIVDAAGIGGGFQQLLADILGISRTRELLPSAQFVSTLVSRFVGAHPAATASDGLAISLFDALNNLAPWGTTYGPIAGGHTGILDPSAPPQSVLLGPAFAVGVNGTSTLANFQGIDLSLAAAGLLRRPQPPTGVPAGDTAIWDLSLTGSSATDLVSTASTSLRMSVFEKNGFVPTCTSFSNCVDNTPTTPVGTTFVWSTPTWQLENLLAFTARGAYATRRVHLSYALGAVQIDVGQNGLPAGWSEYFTLAGIGSPPADQYLWETLSEVAQVALHRVVYGGTTTFLAEGIRGTLRVDQIDVHVTSDQFLTALLPSLASRTTSLGTLALGDYAASNADLDFFVARGDDGVAYLAFVSPDDPRPTATYPYTKPGFFADDALAAKVSTPVVLHSTESSHEAVALEPGVARTFFVQDAAGEVYRITATLDAGGTAVEVSVGRATCSAG
jgi:hypothetical protein